MRWPLVLLFASSACGRLSFDPAGDLDGGRVDRDAAGNPIVAPRAVSAAFRQSCAVAAGGGL